MIWLALVCCLHAEQCPCIHGDSNQYQVIIYLCIPRMNIQILDDWVRHGRNAPVSVWIFCLYNSICLHFSASWMILTAVSPSSLPEQRGAVEYCMQHGRERNKMEQSKLTWPPWDANKCRIKHKYQFFSFSQICSLMKGSDWFPSMSCLLMLIYIHLHPSSIFQVMDQGLTLLVRMDQNCKMSVFVRSFFFASLFVVFFRLKNVLMKETEQI